MMIREKYCQIWLSAIPGLGSQRCLRLVNETAGGHAAEIFSMQEKELTDLTVRAEKNREQGVKTAAMILRGRKTAKERADAASAAMEKSGMGYVCIEDKEYPDRLRRIPDPPYGLFFLGRFPAWDEPSAAIIGARNCTEYGLFQARRFAKAFAKAGVSVISGMARGIDAAAQSAALESGTRSIAVLGSGADVCYPESERRLYESLAAHGTIISEYPPGTVPAKGNFPARNRIISGLCDKLLVVEARKKSGTMITVAAALEQARDVWAVPGRCTDPNSEGCNQLIFDGAGIAVSPEYLIESFFGTGNGRTGDKSDAEDMQTIKAAKLALLEKRIPENEGPEVYVRLYSLLNEWEEKSAEQLCHEMYEKYQCELRAGEAAFRMMRLTLLGYCRETASGGYIGT